MATNYGLRVLTPTNSTRHPFAVVLTPNLNGFRTASYPALKPVVFSVPGTLGMSPTGTWNYFQVDVPTNLPGWRIVLSSTNGGTPSLYVRQATLPLSTAYDKVGVVQNLSTVVYSATEALAGTYFIGVYLPPSAQSNAVYQLGTEVTGMPDLAWDPGQTHEGTLFYTNTSLTGGNYFFRALPQTTTVGAWRLALMVFDGEANLYLRQGTFDPSPANYTTFRSERVGSDGFVVPASQFAVGQTWYVCVVTSPGAHWTLLSGEAYVLKLGTLAPPGSTASSTNVQMGPEGMRFFQTATTPDTLAWRLGLRGATNALLVKSAAVPLPLNAATYDVQQNGQMLLVPSYLVPGNAYYIGVAGAPGDSVNLDSRQQAIVDVPFLSTNSLVVSDYGYVTYRISVPVQQMAWALSVSPSLGDANLCVRRDYVANEWKNDAFSEVPGATTDSLSLVPPTLSDGTFFVTVYGGTNSLCNYSGSFVSGNPSISPVAYVSTTVNDDPARVGWRYYQVSDIQAQLGSLGWELFLQNQPPGTEIALRRNAVPSRWNYRQNNGVTAFSKGYVDYSSVQGFLQRPAHQADIWYVGVYNPSNVMGSFILNLQEIPRNPIAFDGAGAWTNVTVQTPGRFSYFRVEVPVGASGWDVRLTNVTSGTPRLVVRRDQLPDSLLTTSGWIPNSSSNWLGGNQWAAADDWTDLLRDPAGVSVDGRILACGLGNPLAPGTYYVGILNATADPAPMSYTLSSRGIGAGYSIPVNLLDYTNGSATISNLPLREVAYFQVTIGTNCDSWKMHLATNSGEALLLVQKDALPNVAAAQSSPLTLNGGRMVQKAGDEEYVLFPAGTNASLPPGTYYLAVVSEGQNPDRNQSRVGVGAIQALLTSQGSVAPQGLGTLAGMDLGAGGAWRAGEVQAYRFTVAPGVVAFELWLDSRVGNPRMTLQTNALYPTPLDRYGNDGGVVPAWSNDRLIQVANPVAGDYTLLVDAAMYNGVYTNASGTLRVHPLTAPPIAFDGGLFSANGIHPALSWRYFSITVPSNAVGWDVRLTNVTSGDPRMVVRRDLVPDTLLSSGAPWAQKQWPSGAQWAAGLDWTGYPYDPDGTNQNGHILQMGMGNPLEPGNYIVGVSSGTSYGYGTNEMRYTLVSRGIGPGLSLPVTDLTFTNGLMVLTNLPAREVAYFSVVVPTNVTSWALRLGTNAGDGLLCVQKDALPNVGAAATPPQTLSGGRKVQKVANEQYTLLTANGQTNFPSGTYYLAVISEGWNPGVPNASRIGTNIASLTCQSLGAMPRTDLGTIQSDASVSYPDVLEGGATKEYQFTVAPGTMSLEVRLDQRIGNPRMSLRADSLIPMPAGTYGCDGGQTRTWQQDSQIVIPNPTNGIYTLVVQADYTGPGSGSLSVYSNAAYTVMVRAAGSLPVPFDGGIVTVTGHPANTWKYYLVTNIAADALGWDVRLVNVTSGDPRLVIRRDQPPNSLQSSGSFWNLRQWPSNGQWAAALDWTGYVSDGDGTNQNGHILQMGMHNPLEPGVYYIGVFNGTAYGTGLNPMSYTLQCRGIGPGYSIPVAPLPFTVVQACLGVFLLSRI